jgi:SAM-dependent methyltransferase
MESGEIGVTYNERYSAYDSFAWFYNRYWGASWVARVMPILEKLLLTDTPPPAAVLDLCCGTGHLAEALSQRGYSVTGVDGSEAMLAYARENAPNSSFHLADARSFELNQTFDLALSTYDSLNHVLELDGLRSVFRRVHQVLKPGGRFLFDLNTEAGYMANWKPERAWPMVADDHLLAVKPSYKAETRIATFEATMFRLTEDRWVRSDLTLEQRSYPTSEILEALEKVGFSEPYVSLADERFGEECGWPGQGRGFFRAMKPTTARR